MTRRIQKSNSLTPAYEDAIEVANKITFRPRQEDELTILVEVPVGKEGRKKTAQLLPLISKLDKFQGDNVSLTAITEVIFSIWDADKFEEEILPFVLGMDDKEGRDYLEKLSLMEVFQAFVKAVTYILSGGMADETVAAVKN